jgi:hypothetical protein
LDQELGDHFADLQSRGMVEIDPPGESPFADFQ